ncbi:MAG TPA: pyrimidine utilization protein D [Allosphingosinicella sp.]|jgi:aminoacrylate hydrolase
MRHSAGLWYQFAGSEEAETVILSAGLGGTAGYWAPNLEAFLPRFRVLLYDQRGTGRSDRALPAEVTVEDMAQDVAGLMDELRVERAHFVGHAAGGLIGLALALARPELVTKLVVASGWARLDPYTARCFDVRLALLRDSGPEMYLKAQPIFLYPPYWVSEHSDRLDAEAGEQLAHFPGAENVEKRIAAVRAFDISGRLREIETPTLVLSAFDDALVPSEATTALAHGLPNGRHMGLMGGGHAANVTDPDEFSTIVPPWLAGETIFEE